MTLVVALVLRYRLILLPRTSHVHSRHPGVRAKMLGYIRKMSTNDCSVKYAYFIGWPGSALKAECDSYHVWGKVSVKPLFIYTEIHSLKVFENVLNILLGGDPMVFPRTFWRDCIRFWPTRLWDPSTFVLLGGGMSGFTSCTCYSVQPSLG